MVFARLKHIALYCALSACFAIAGKAQDTALHTSHAKLPWYTRLNISFGEGYHFKKSTYCFTPYQQYATTEGYYIDALNYAQLLTNADVEYTANKYVKFDAGFGYQCQPATPTLDLWAYSFKDFITYLQLGFYVPVKTVFQPFIGMRINCDAKLVTVGGMSDLAMNDRWNYNGTNQPTLFSLQVPFGIALVFPHVKVTLQSSINTLGYITGTAHDHWYKWNMLTGQVYQDSHTTTTYGHFVSFPDFIKYQFLWSPVTVTVGFNL